MNIRYFSFITYSFLIIACKPQPVRVPTNSSAQSLFWEISGKNLRQPSYLFGTHHLFNSRFLRENDVVNQKIEKADVVMGEMLMDGDVLMKTAMAGLMADNTLDKLLSKEDYEATDKVLQEQMGIGLGLMRMFKPITVYLLITNAKHLKALGMNPTDRHVSIDEYFQQKGKESGKTVVGLETVDEQIQALFGAYPMERQLELLREAVYDTNQTVSGEIQDLNRLYAAQQLDKLYKVARKSMRPEEYQQLLVNRNHRWMEQIGKKMPGQPLFIAVGAMHLAGPDGLITQLRAQGYTVKPVAVQVSE